MTDDYVSEKAQQEILRWIIKLIDLEFRTRKKEGKK